MTASAFEFHRPSGLEAAVPPELRGTPRDRVRLLVSEPDRTSHLRFSELPEYLRPGDLLVVNRSATLPASLPATGPSGPFRLHLSTKYGARLWLAEARWSFDRPGPVGLLEGASVRVGSVEGRLVAGYPGIPRLAFFRFDRPVEPALAELGAPIRYAYAQADLPLSAYQTVFADVPGSAEMPSAGRPFTPELVGRLRAAGIAVASLTLHTGVSSLEAGDVALGRPPVYPEPFEVDAAAVAAVERARRRGGRVLAVGTTVMRALESAAPAGVLRPTRGFTQAYLEPRRPRAVVDGLLTGFHDPGTSHLALLCSVAPVDRVRSAYRTAVAGGYLWHEFGDSHLLWPDD